MKNKSVTICMMVAIVFVSRQVMAFTQYNDGGTYDITTTINDDVWVDWQSPGVGTTVNVLSGGSITFPYILQGFNNSGITMSGGSIDSFYANDSSQMTMSGGMLNGLQANDSSQITISGGTVTANAWVYDNSQVILSGGTMNQRLYAYGGQITLLDGTMSEDWYAYSGSQITISGGMVNRTLYASGGQVTLLDGTVNENLYASGGQVIMSGGIVAGSLSVVGGQVTMSGGSIDSELLLSSDGELIIVGSNFAIDGNSVDSGEVITSILGGDKSSEPFRLLTGTLANGDIINNQFKIGNSASITLVPEPATLGVLLLGGLVLLRREKRAATV